MLVNFKNKHPLAFCLVTAVFSIASLLIVTISSALVLGVVSVFTGTEALITDEYIITFIAEGITAVILILFATASGTISTFKQKTSGAMHAIIVSLYPLIFIAYVAVAMLVDSLTNGYALKPFISIIFFILAMIGIGFYEEFVFRGIIARTLLLHYGTNTKGAWKAAIVSGVLFGSVHIVNAIGLPLFGVLIQTVVAIVLGILFAAIYFRTGNLWICVILHTAINTASLLQGGLYDVGGMDEMISSFTLINLLPAVTYFIPVPFLMRKSKNHEIQEQFGEPLNEQPIEQY